MNSLRAGSGATFFIFLNPNYPKPGSRGSKNICPTLWLVRDFKMSDINNSNFKCRENIVVYWVWKYRHLSGEKMKYERWKMKWGGCRSSLKIEGGISFRYEGVLCEKNLLEQMAKLAQIQGWSGTHKHTHWAPISGRNDRTEIFELIIICKSLSLLESYFVYSCTLCKIPLRTSTTLGALPLN